MQEVFSPQEKFQSLSRFNIVDSVINMLHIMNMHAMMIPLWNPDDSHPSDTYDTDYWLATSSLLSPIDDISNE